MDSELLQEARRVQAVRSARALADRVAHDEARLATIQADPKLSDLLPEAQDHLAASQANLAAAEAQIPQPTVVTPEDAAKEQVASEYEQQALRAKAEAALMEKIGPVPAEEDPDPDVVLAAVAELRGEESRSAQAEAALSAQEAKDAELTANLAAAYTAPPTFFDRIFGGNS